MEKGNILIRSKSNVVTGSYLTVKTNHSIDLKQPKTSSDF